MLDAAQLEAAITEAGENPENVELPEYTFDCHTSKGKKAGKSKDEFFQAEFATLQPKERGEFDHVVRGYRN
jgi:hypothetical protein